MTIVQAHQTEVALARASIAVLSAHAHLIEGAVYESNRGSGVCW
jgi:hypothetical protein